MRSPAKIEHGVRCCASRNVLKCHGCPYQGEPYCRERLLKDVQDYLKAIRKCGARIEQQVKQLEVAQPKWISVEERLPEVGEVVLVRAKVKPHESVSHDALTFASYWNDECWVVDFLDDTDEIIVTHWMLLPSVPKEEAC